MTKNIEKLLYTFFGNNIIIGYHIKQQLNFLKRILPKDFKGKEIHDIGCGDGKVTVRLKEIFQSEKCSGYDINEKLVRLAQKRGIKAEVMDIEKEIPSGEIAIIWGVLHHLVHPQKILRKIKDNYKYIFMREPLRTRFPLHIELGNPFEKSLIKGHLKESLGIYRSYIYKNAIFVFWVKN